MAGIAWWIWLGIGLFVSLSSVYTGGPITIFAWIGLVFIVIGIAKLAYLFVISPKETKQEKIIEQTGVRRPNTQYCPQCRNVTEHHDIFCRACGRRLR